ncbi:TRAP transporter, DctM subunit [Amycolatopsis marina]|uniref:TRAP transporter, DctM subunit n=1 Tax=Amycolatopsis marina TaxID=490629 RepID=A0A1I1BVX4_9PSEU|nr:TRAP transporter large permease [Amycolatopsis marina]SFB53836.1 TRAP transporter, DctM subunit [Amycolatopsis marina]
MITGILLLVGLLVLILVGVPVSYAFLATAAVYLLFVLELPVVTVAQRVGTGADSFALTAIPLFLLAGSLMNAGGITRRLINFANLLVGWLPGGLGAVNIAVSVFFAGISGSAVADASAVGKAMIPGMVQQGYPRSFAAGVTAGSSIVGPIIPPSIPIIVYGLASGLPIGALFLAGVFPGLLFGLVILIMTVLISLRRGYPRMHRITWSHALTATRDAIAALIMPLIIVLGIVSGIFTATESAAIAAFYALLLAAVFYRELNWRDIPKVFLETAVLSAAILFIIALASAFGWVLIRSGFPQVLSGALANSGLGVVGVLLLINLALLVFGMFMESNAAILVFTPLLLPIAAALDIDPIHLGIIIVFNLMMGLLTPPVGMCLFVTSSIARLPVMTVARAAWPYLASAVVTLIVITYWPPLTTWLPSQF